MITVPVSQELRRIRRVALGDILHRTARRFGNRFAVIDGERKMTYAELDATSSQFAHYLLGRFDRGAHVATLCHNSADMLLAIAGIQKAGNVWVPVNYLLDVPQIKYILEHAEVSCVVVDDEICQQPELISMIRDLNLPLIVTRASDSSSPLGITISESCHNQLTSMPDIEIDQDQVAFIMYTSGTTGNPKGVMHSHASAYYGTIANHSTFGFNERDVVSCMLPMFHIGQYCVVSSGCMAGVCLIIFRGFRPKEVVEAILRERISVTIGLPMMYGAILAEPSAQDAEFSSMRLCVYAMAPMPRGLVDKIAVKMTQNIMLTTGQTEIFPVTMSFRPVENPGRDANYWGISTAVCETEIMNDEGELLPQGEIGEIVHRGPNAMLGYFKDPEATEAAQHFSWHHTGDLGMIDEGGQLLFLDRKKDMIKTGGENVASIKVESAILSHPAVAAVAVVGLPHPHWTEAICAFVVLREGFLCTEKELDAHCRKLLGKFEVPKAIKLLDSLPATATGKMQKHVLRNRYADLWASEPI